MIRKYIRGNQERGSEVLKELKKLGGTDIKCYGGNNKELYYWVGNNNEINTCKINSDTAEIIEELFEEIKLPKEKLKVIRGNKEKGKEVIKLLEDMGGWNKCGLKGESIDNYYLIEDSSIVCKLWNDEFFNDFELEILELPEIGGPNHQFKPFERVLVRDSIHDSWICTFFSHKDESKANMGCIYFCSGGKWKYCIPFEGNEHLVGTKINID